MIPSIYNSYHPNNKNMSKKQKYKMTEKLRKTLLVLFIILKPPETCISEKNINLRLNNKMWIIIIFIFLLICKRYLS